MVVTVVLLLFSALVEANHRVYDDGVTPNSRQFLITEHAVSVVDYRHGSWTEIRRASTEINSNGQARHDSIISDSVWNFLPKTHCSLIENAQCIGCHYAFTV
jgi:hypothetical protein